MDWIKKVKKWFQDSSDKGQPMIIDDMWTVEADPENENKIYVNHDFIPFSLMVLVGKKVMNLILYTNIDTATWSHADRLTLYRDLLVRNDESLYVKFILAGRNDTIALRMDLNLVYLNKEEFNDSLEAMIEGGYWLLNKLNIEEKEELLMKNIIGNITKRLEQGITEDRLVKEMINAGIMEKDAQMLITETKKRMLDAGNTKKETKSSSTQSYIR